MTPRALFAALLLAISLPTLAATEIIQLNYRMAEDVLPIAQSLVGDEGRVNAYGNQLVVNASPEKIEELRELLARLDSQPKRLLISVDTNESGFQHDQGYAVDGAISGGNVVIQSGAGEVQGRDQVRIIRRSTNSRSGGVQQVQATEGYPALIQIGQSVPITTTSTNTYGQVYQNTQYRNVTRGFYVTANLSGDRVTVTLSSNNDRLSQSHPGVIDIQSTDTRLNGRVGEWIAVGGVNQSSQGNDSDFLRHHSTQGRDDMSMRLKVEVLD